MKTLDTPDKVIFICDGSSCGKHSKGIRKHFRELIKEGGLKGEVEVVKMDCTDNCDDAPVICIQPANVWFGEVSNKKVKTLFEEYIE